MKFALLLCFIWLLQYLLTHAQFRYYQNTSNAMVQRHQGEGAFVFSGKTRRRLLPGVLVLVAVRDDYHIAECRILKGVSVFSRFRLQSKMYGLHVAELLDEDVLNEHRYGVAEKKALMQVSEQAMLHISEKHTIA